MNVDEFVGLARKLQNAGRRLDKHDDMAGQRGRDLIKNRMENLRRMARMQGDIRIDADLIELAEDLAKVAANVKRAKDCAQVAREELDAVTAAILKLGV